MLKIRLRNGVFWAVFGVSYWNCSHPNQVSFTSNVPAKLYQVSIEQGAPDEAVGIEESSPAPNVETLVQDADPIGTLPIKLEAEQLDHKIFMVSAEGFVPHRIYFREPPKTNMKFDLTLEPTKCLEQQEISESKENLYFNKLLKAHTAMLEKDFDKAQRLAKEITAAKPYLSAPKVILGLNAMYQGENGAALEFFENALETSPQDFEIRSLIDFAKERQSSVADGP